MESRKSQEFFEELSPSLQNVLSLPSTSQQVVKSSNQCHSFVRLPNVENNNAVDGFSNLPDEMILQIFKWLPKKTLLHCAMVCHRFRRCAIDKSLWKRLDLAGMRLKSGSLEYILKRDTIILRLAQTIFIHPVFNGLHFESKLQYLDLSNATINKESLKLLMSRCRELKMLSLENLPLSYEICMEISKNINLKTLNLAMCSGLEAWNISEMVTPLIYLTSLNISWTNLSIEAVSSLVANIAPNILYLNLAGCRQTLLDNHLIRLAERCIYLIDLDLSDCRALTSNAIPIICTFQKLECLSLSRCFGIDAMAYIELRSMPSLHHLNLFGIFTARSLTRSMSKASYLPRQSLNKADNSDLDHGSYKQTLHSNEDLVNGSKSNNNNTINTSTSSNNILAIDTQQHQQQQHSQQQQQSVTKLPNNLPDVLPLGAKLQPTLTQTNISLLSGSSSATPLRYDSNKNLAGNTSSNNNNISQTSYNLEQQQQQHQQQHLRFSTPALNTFNLTHNYNRSQAFDAALEINTTTTTTKTTTTVATTTSSNIINNNKNDTNCSGISIDQLIMDFKNNVQTTVEEQHNKSNFNNEKVKEEGRKYSLDSLRFSYNTNATRKSNESRLFRAELVNTTLPNSPHTVKKPVIIRQESLRENIEKITQLQSQLMSAHIQDNNILRMNNCKSGSNIGYTGQDSTSGNNNTTDTSTDSINSITGIPICPGQRENPFDLMKSLKSEQIELLQDHSVEQSENGKDEIKKMEKEEDKGQKHYQLEEEITKPDPQECKESKDEKNILSQLDDNMDGLKLLQRSELILRVNPGTVEAASQTDADLTTNDPDVNTDANKEEMNDSSIISTTSSITLKPRQKHIIELDCDKLAEELIILLPPDNRLLHLLRPKGSKTIADYISQLYNSHIPCRPSKRHVGTSTLTRSHCKLQHDFDELSIVDEKLRMEISLGDIELNQEKCHYLKRKLDDFVKHLQIKARVLSKEHIILVKESAINDELGKTLIDKFIKHIKPLEASKCRSFISDIGHITNLLLALSERLAKTENQLIHFQFYNNITEKKILENKRDSLYEKLNEAKRIKEDIDRRGVIVFNVLEKQLSADDYADFLYFINMKVKLITDSHEISDNIKTDEELLNAVSDIFRQSDC